MREKVKPKSHTPGQPGEYAEAGAKAVRPRDAATLIIVRQLKTPKILLGKRAASHNFMPNKFVFPGGRRDAADARVTCASDLRPDVLKRLRKETRANVTDNSLRGLALAAIREAFEETGLILGETTVTPPTSRHREWSAYFGHGVAPPLAHMDFIARAVTPTYRTRRFDTRFFMMYDTHIHTDPEDTRGASGELLDLHWLTIAQARKLDLPAITRQVLDIVEQRMQLPFEKRFAAPAPYIKFERGKPVISQL
jgi:8-oxo-dGTP pyrophosphatase MutT (NUDIX family)